jgi:hypothetical protein
LIPFLIDENVPVSVARFLEERGHQVVHVRDILPRGTADQIVALVADEQGSIIVTWNAKDFERLVRQVPEGGRQRFRSASRLTFKCNEAHGLRLITEHISWIEFEWAEARRRPNPRVMLEIGESYRKSWR